MNKIFLILIIILAATTTYSQWQWQNPKPTGNDLMKVQFINTNVGWFVGINGTIFKTTDGGQKWFILPGNVKYDYTAFYPLSTDTLWIAAFGYGEAYDSLDPTFKLLFSSDGGSTWQKKADGVTFGSEITHPRLGHIHDLYFVNSQTGYAVGDSGFTLKTTDAGADWKLLSRPTQYKLDAVQFFDSLNGYIAGGDHYSALCDYPPACPSYSHGIMMRTTDGGMNWYILYQDTLKIHDIYFLTPLLGWATGTQNWDEGLTPYVANFILKTTDGGQSWSFYRLSGSFFSLHMKSIYFSDGAHGWAVGTAGAVERTTDGGSTWILSYPVQRPETRFLNSVVFIDTLRGYSVGTGGVILQTSDGGLTWQHYDSWANIGSNNSDVHFINSDTGWIVSTFILYRTTDKGEHWENQNVYGWHIDCVDGGNCWAVSGGGNIVNTSDAGDTWTNQTSGTSAYLRDVKFFNSLIGWAVGDGTVIKTTDGGKSWLTQRSDPEVTGYSQIVIQNTLRVWVYCLGRGPSIQSTDGGATWFYPESRPCFFLNQDTGWASGYRTFDGGKTWEPLGVGFSDDAKFGSVNRGWHKSLHTIWGTHDGGYTWSSEIKVDVYHALYGEMHFIDSVHGWAVGMSGTLLRYGYPEFTINVPENNKIIPKQFNLFQNYPNPFNPNTTIEFAIPQASYVTLKIYNMLGQEIATVLEHQDMEEGSQEVEFNAGMFASGVYFYKLEADGYATEEAQKPSKFTEIKKMILMK